MDVSSIHYFTMEDAKTEIDDTVIVIISLRPKDVIDMIPESKMGIETWPVKLSDKIVYLPIVLVPNDPKSLDRLTNVLTPYAVCSEYGNLDLPNMVEIQFSTKYDYNTYYVYELFMKNFKTYWEDPILNDDTIVKTDAIDESLDYRYLDVIDYWKL